MKLLFLDESGDHNLSVIDPQYPLFILGGVIVDAAYAEGPMASAFDAFKLEMFGSRDIVLHTADMTRNRNGFEVLKNASFRKRFLSRLNRLIADLDFSVIACAVRKDEHLSRFGVAALDPYLLSLDVVVDRFCFEIGDVSSGGAIIAERRNPVLDRELDIAWLNLKVQGARHMRARDIDNRISSLRLVSKKDNLPGLQLADLVLTPIGRYLLGRPTHADWTIVESKLRRGHDRKIEGSGLVVLPKK